MTAVEVEVIWSVVSLIVSLASMIYCVVSIACIVEAHGGLRACWGSIDFMSRILLVVVVVLVIAMAVGIVANLLSLMTLLA